ncbi:MAG: hypothetical protein QNJ14_09425 [Woeseiaceae bacterium]|nr:hypothetical protein [Woeseiaceae bacterium]
MNKFAKGLLKNLALIALTIGMIGGFVTYDELKEQRAANKDVIKIDIEKASLGEFVGKYVDIHGGYAEIRETYEYGIGDLGDGKEMLASQFYYPIVLVEGGAPQFIVVADAPPAVGGDNPTSRTGILKAHQDIPDKVAGAFAAQYPDVSLALLDTQYTPAPLAKMYANLIGFLLLIVASFFVFRFAVREAPKPQEDAA